MMSEHKSAVREDGYQSHSRSLKKVVSKPEDEQEPPIPASAAAAASSSAAPSASPSKSGSRHPVKLPQDEKSHEFDTAMDEDAPAARSHPRRTVKKTQTFVPGVSQFTSPEAIQATAKAKAAASSSSSSSSKKPRKSRAHSHSDSDPYGGEGFTVRDHRWYNQAECTIKYAVPPIENISHHYRRITCEEACRVSGYQVSRNMIVDLEPSNVAKLNAALGSDKETGETDKLVLQMCDSGEINKCALYQSDPNDIDSIKVVTTKFVRSGEPVAIYMGRLVELSQFEAEYGDRLKYNLSSYEIHPDALPADYVKNGGVPLMLDTNMYVNEAKFIRDPLWDDHEVSANVQCRIVWNHARGLPYVAMIALGNIVENVELLVNWGELAWSAHARLKLHRMAHQSHRMHFRLKQLYELIQQEGVDKYKTPHELRITDDVPFEDFHYSAPTKGKSKKASEERKSGTAAAAASSSLSSLPPPAASSFSRTKPVPLPEGTPNFYRLVPRKPSPKQTPTFILRSTPHVFENCQVKLFKNCDYSALEPKVLAAWKAAGARFAPPVSALKPSLKTVLQTGRCPKTAVYEVVSLRHPARFYSPPDCAIYSMLARNVIAKHEPIGVYVGKIFEKERFHGDYDPEDRIKQVYAYDMSTDLFEGLEEKLTKSNNAKSALKVSDLPSLVCESLSVGGNETRFINDSWCRIGGSDCKNAEALPMFNPLNGNLPVMIIRATRTIQKGEEIVTDYGETFWNKISTALCLEHSAYQAKADKQIREVEQELYEIQEKKKNPQPSTPLPVAPASPAADEEEEYASQASDVMEFTYDELAPRRGPLKIINLDWESESSEEEDAKSPPPAAAAASTSAAAASSTDAPVPLDSVTPFLYSTPSPAAAFLPPPPNPWECLRSPFNSWDVKYAHRPNPVRYDPVKHDDIFVREVLASQRAIVSDQVAKEKLKAEKVVAATSRPVRPRVIPKPPPPPRKFEGARTSSRIAFIQSGESEKHPEQVEQERKMKAARLEAKLNEKREARSAKKKLAAERLVSEANEPAVKQELEVDSAQPAALEEPHVRYSPELPEAMLANWGMDGVEKLVARPVVEEKLADAANVADEPPAETILEVETSSSSGSDSDSDVVILDDAPPTITKSKPVRKSSNNTSDAIFPCECGEIVASWRSWQGKSFFACLACYLKHQQRHPNSSPDRKRKRIHDSEEEDEEEEKAANNDTEMGNHDERKEDPPARLEESASDKTSVDSPLPLKPHKAAKKSKRTNQRY